MSHVYGKVYPAIDARFLDNVRELHVLLGRMFRTVASAFSMGVDRARQVLDGA